MSDAVEIGVSLALSDGVSEGIAQARRDLAQLEQVLSAGAISIARLREAGVSAASVTRPAERQTVRATPEAASTGEGEVQTPAAAAVSQEAVTMTQRSGTLPRPAAPVTQAAVEPVMARDRDMPPSDQKGATRTGPSMPPPRGTLTFPSDASGVAPVGAHAAPIEAPEQRPVRDALEPVLATRESNERAASPQTSTSFRLASPQVLTHQSAWPTGAVPDMRPPPDVTIDASDADPAPTAPRQSGPVVAAARTPAPVESTWHIDVMTGADTRPPVVGAPPSTAPAAAPVPDYLETALRPVHAGLEAPNDRDRAGQAPSAPPAAAQSRPGPNEGDVFLDGLLVGRWISRFLAKEAGRPSVGPTGFDPRRGRLMPGPTVGG